MKCDDEKLGKTGRKKNAVRTFRRNIQNLMTARTFIFFFCTVLSVCIKIMIFFFFASENFSKQGTLFPTQRIILFCCSVDFFSFGRRCPQLGSTFASLGSKVRQLPSFSLFFSSFGEIKGHRLSRKGWEKIRSDEKNGAGRDLGQMVTAPIRLAREIETILLHLGAPWGPLAAGSQTWLSKDSDWRWWWFLQGPGRRLRSAGSGG